MKFKKPLRFLGLGLLVFTLGFALILTAVVYVVAPDVGKLDECFETSLYKVNVCPKSSSYVRLNSISPISKRAIIVSEDGTFYSHSGFDWYELRESILKNLKDFRYARGGSTITQQLAKNAFLSSEKTIFRKLLEAFTAHRIEKMYSKDLILEKYLNMVEFGPNIYGIKTASQRYFSKPPSEIHLLEAVWLAHLLPNPKVYSQGIRQGRLTPYSQDRVKILLQRLLKYGDITRAQYDFAVSQIPYFPWRHLSASDFEIPGYDPAEQQRALEELMNSDEWIEDTEDHGEIEPE